MDVIEFFDTSDLYTEEITLRLDKTNQALPEKGWVPAYYFTICLPDGTPVGGCDLRIGHTRKTYLGGNIGYHVDETFRGHHYAAKACLLLFRLAKKHGMDHLYITCPVDNPASARTCELASGKLVETADVPEDNDMYAEGSWSKLRKKTASASISTRSTSWRNKKSRYELPCFVSALSVIRYSLSSASPFI